MHALGTFARPGEPPFPGLVLGGETVVDLSGYGWRDTNQILAGWAAARAVIDRLAEAEAEAVAVAEARATGDDHGAGRAGGDIPLDELMILAPLAPGQVLQSGANYRRHVIDLVVAEEAERGELSPAQAQALGAEVMDQRAGGEPYIFLGAPTAVAGPYDEIILPRRGEQHDWELELAAVIGIGGRHIPRDQALAHVAGYTIANDLTTRDLVYRPDLQAIGTDWLRAKNAPTFLPLGPWIVPAQFVHDPQSLSLTLSVGGELMQDASTAEMIFDVAALVSYASSLVTLRPGDVVLTGSPAGNGMHHRRFLQPGDVIEATITGLGHQRNLCVGEAP